MCVDILLTEPKENLDFLTCCEELLQSDNAVENYRSINDLTQVTCTMAGRVGYPKRIPATSTYTSVFSDD